MMLSCLHVWKIGGLDVIASSI
uniref:Uncharacterized protein n=1 Tax=Arundo donax TaxID=35708 RepID=A0A0A9A5N7_ARUDO